MKRDTLYASPRDSITPFVFDQSVVSVFDDMITRSIPHYRENLLYLTVMATSFLREDGRLYDLGCSTGNLSISLAQHCGATLGELVSVDSSEDMLHVLTSRATDLKLIPPIKTVHHGLEDLELAPCSLVYLNYTLQFLPVEHRGALLSRILKSLHSGGALFLSEKIISQTPLANRIEHDMHAAYKKERCYSDLEISQKRNALERVLISEDLHTHIHRLKQVGFAQVTVWYRWFNFVGLYAVKA